MNATSNMNPILIDSWPAQGDHEGSQSDCVGLLCFFFYMICIGTSSAKSAESGGSSHQVWPGDHYWSTQGGHEGSQSEYVLLRDVTGTGSARSGER